MLGSNWERVLENVRTFINVRDAHSAAGGNRCRVTFQLTFMKVNYAELPAVVELAAGLGVDRVKGHHLRVHTAEMNSQSMRRDPEAIARWNEAVAGPGPRAATGRSHSPLERGRGFGHGRCGALSSARRASGPAGKHLPPG